MSNEQKLNIEKSLKRCINQAPALDFEKLAAMPVIKMTEHDYITRQQPPAKQRGKMIKYFKPVSAVLAGCLVMFAGVSTWFAEFKTPDSIIALDANQGVEIVANKHRQILSVKAYDQEVQGILNEENLNQDDLEESVSVIIATMIRNGYLDESKNVVMVSVENQNPTKANDMAVTLNQVIASSASAENLTATVVRQSVTPDQEALTEAEQYNVSTGKLNVMKELVTADSTLTMESLAAMSLTDLLQVSKDKSVDLTDVIQVDDPQKQTKEISDPESQIDNNTVEVIPVAPGNNSQPEPATEQNNSSQELSDSTVEQIPAETAIVKPDVIVNPDVSVAIPTEDKEKITMELPDKNETEPVLDNQNDGAAVKPKE